MLEEYIKVLHIEALTILDMTKRGIIPAVVEYLKDLTEVVKNKKAISSEFNCKLEESLINTISDLAACLYKNVEKLDNSILEAKNQDGLLNTAKYYREVVFINMQELRSVIDNLETKIGKKYWPFPTYGELLYSVY